MRNFVITHKFVIKIGMAISKDKKKEIIEKLSRVFANAESLAFVNFHGLSVDETNAIRRALSEAGVSYTVARKTLIKVALKDAPFKGETPELPGELAIVSSENDATAAAREIYTFVKKHDGSLAILGGVFEGQYRDQEGMTEIATIPSLHVLRGMFVNVINSPIQGLVVGLAAVADKKA